jgi:ankyrin repeat protein
MIHNNLTFSSFVTQDQDMMNWLLDRGPDPNKRCGIHLTPLSYAVKYASIPNMKLLLGSGGNTQQGQLLFHALERKSEIIEVLRLLLKEGASLNATMYQKHYPSWALYFFMGLGTVLHKAAELGNIQFVSFLISQGIDLSITDANGRNALDCARNIDKVEVVKALEDSLNH